ncbi:hypothetical protein [Sulfitobacter sp.]|jgi:hypothetical protein|uniref:hypothetical protein n=1 Tax=Sulfitobacter sp. TaxID=1903071 RepID=UPI00300243AE
MSKVSTAIVIAFMMATPAVAKDFKAVNGIVVVPHAKGFAVTGDAGLGARGIWCAAADYVRKTERVKPGQRLYVAEDRERGLGQRNPVVFTVSPAGLTPSSAVILGTSISRAGANLSVGHAFGFCSDHKLSRGGNL